MAVTEVINSDTLACALSARPSPRSGATETNAAGRSRHRGFPPPPFAAIYSQVLIRRLGCQQRFRGISAETEVELEVVEPGDVGVDALAAEFRGQVLVVFPKALGVWGVVEGDDDGVVVDADVSVDAVEDAARQVFGVPRGIGRTETAAQLLDGALGEEGQGHLAEADVEVLGAGALPA